jgi:glutathione S-transferase
MYKLYYAPGTCALASHIALEEAGADYSAIRLDFKANQQQSPDYLKINTKGRVPALATDKGIITENPAILAFVAQTFPNAKLAPLDDPFAFAQVQSFNSYLCGTVHVAHAHKGRGYRWATQESSFADMKGMVPKSMGACFDLIEKGMRSLSLHDRALARRRHRRSQEPAEGRRPHEAHGGSPGREEGDGGPAGQSGLVVWI